MRMKLFLPPLAFLTLFALPMCPTYGIVVTFDDISVDANGIHITNAYSGLVWSNFGVLNAVDVYDDFGSNGYFYGMLTSSNVAYNGFGSPAEIDSAGTNFNLLDAFLTGAWNSNLNVSVQGFSGGALLYATTVVVSATQPTLVDFNYLNVDRVLFDSFGGQDAGFIGHGAQFAMDNITIEFVPEPSSLLLASLAALLLWPVLKRHGHRGHPVGVVGRRCEAADGVLAPSRRLVESTCRKTTFVRWLPTR